MNRTYIFVFALALVTMLLVGCDSAITPNADLPVDEENGDSRVTGVPEFALAREYLDASLISGSIDDIFVRLGDRYEGFGGVYEDERGYLVLVSKQPENIRTAQSELVSEFLEMMGASDKFREVLLGKPTRIQQATYSFTDLAVYRTLFEGRLRSDRSLVLTDVDERQNAVLVGFDEIANISEANVRSMAVELGIPPEAIMFESVAVPEFAVSSWPSPERSAPTMSSVLTGYVRPLAGGLRIESNGGCTLGLPVWYGSPGNQTRGFLTASHCTIFVGYNNGSEWGQPHKVNAIGVEFEDPPLEDCDEPVPPCLLTDAALIDLNNAHDNSTKTLVAQVYRTSFSSSTGAGSFTISGTPFSMVTTGSPIMGMDVNKVGIGTGWTTGEITGTCVSPAIWVRHPKDGKKYRTRLPCYIKTNTPVNSGDSGSALFSAIDDADGIFLGIQSACGSCDPDVSRIGYFVSWAAIDAAMNENITLYEDRGGS